MKLGVFRTSLKQNEQRVPVYPEHLPLIAERLRRQMVFETGYGADYGYPDAYFTDHGASMAGRERLFTECDILMLPKPVPADLAMMSAGQRLCGWVHCVQQREIAQIAIDRRLTLLAWESMHQWGRHGERKLHVFYKNNEIAGYASVIHALQTRGLDGYYGRRRKAVILSHGSVSRGAIYALQGRGFNNLHVFSRRPPHLIADQNPDVFYAQYFLDSHGTAMARTPEGREHPLIDELADADIICNGVMQDPTNPIMFVKPEEIGYLHPRSLIVDISCDEGMGFPFARPTSFATPAIEIGLGIFYYSVDHAPSYLWNAASREISRALLPYLGTIAAGEESWAADPTIARAVEIRNGVIQNTKILEFQGRSMDFPHAPLAAGRA